MSSPRRKFLLAAVTVFAVELGIMTVVPFLPAHWDPRIVALLDATILTAVLVALFHLLFLRPLRSELDRRERLFREQEEVLALRLRALESAGNGIVLTDREGNVRWANGAFSRLSGFPPEELVGLNLRVLKSGRQTPEFYGGMWETIRAGGVWKGEVVNRRRDGTTYVADLTISPVKDASGEVAHFIGIQEDVTARKKAEQEAAGHAESLRRSLAFASMGELLAGVAHELNNPLTVLVGHADLLQRAKGGDVRSRAESIGSAAEHCSQVVRRFLGMVRRKEGDRRSEVTLDEVVREALALYAYPLRADGIEVEFRGDPGLPRQWMDRQEIRQVVLNLVANAHQAMLGAEGPRGLTLSTGPGEGGRSVHLRVADTGPGVPPGIRDRIFESFFTTKPEGVGTGIGLSLCRRLVEEHQGTIRLEDAPGGGACFVVDLPVLLRPAGTVTAPPPGGEGTAPRRVLVVDDEPEVRRVLAESLRMDGHEVATAAGGREALDRLAAGESFDVILTDFHMPELGGLALIAAIDERHPELRDRLILMSGDPGALVRPVIGGREIPVLPKPFSITDLREAVARAGALR